MTKRFLTLFFLLVSSLNYASQEKDCEARPYRVTARHLEPDGIGYDNGYTTLEGFFSFENDLNASWFPFLDVRGHLFNDGRFASNLGLGLRYFRNRIWGINAYYDFRSASKQDFNQISLGLETLGPVWDVRMNGYLPIGAKTSSFYDSKFYKFKEHRLILSSKQTFALKGLDAEFGVHVRRQSRFPLYFAAGPYYLNGKAKSSWGAKGRVSLDLYKYLRLEGRVSYDAIFRTIAQAELSLVIPLGKKMKPRKGFCCPNFFSQDIVARVDRNEIIPIDKRRVKSLAINPQTGDPYFFWFVNNLSSSNGTFESPFNELILAQNRSKPHDIIYVYPGDGTSTGMNAGITLKNHQKLLGAGLDHQLLTTRGNITIPPQSTGLPLLTHFLGEIVTLASQNEVSGVQLRSLNNKGFFCSNIHKALIHRNRIYGFSSLFLSLTGLVYLDGASGIIEIKNNTFILDNNTLGGPIFGVHFISVKEGAQYLIHHNTFDSIQGSSAVAVEFGNRFPNPVSGNFQVISISNNVFNDVGNATAGKAIGGAGFTGTGQLNIQSNQFIGTGASTFGPSETVYIRVRDSGNLTARITNNIWEQSVTPTKSSFEILNMTVNASACVTLTGNRSDHSPVAYELNNSVGGTMIVDVGENVGTVVETNTTPGTCFPF